METTYDLLICARCRHRAARCTCTEPSGGTAAASSGEGTRERHRSIPERFERVTVATADQVAGMVDEVLLAAQRLGPDRLRQALKRDRDRAIIGALFAGDLQAFHARTGLQRDLSGLRHSRGGARAGR